MNRRLPDRIRRRHGFESSIKNTGPFYRSQSAVCGSYVGSIT